MFDQLWEESPTIQKMRAEYLQKGIQKGRQEGRQEGLLEGLLEGIAMDLKAKFAGGHQALLDEVRALKDLDRLRKIARDLKKVKTLHEVRALIAP